MSNQQTPGEPEEITYGDEILQLYEKITNNINKCKEDNMLLYEQAINKCIEYIIETLKKYIDCGWRGTRNRFEFYINNAQEIAQEYATTHKFKYSCSDIDSCKWHRLTDMQLTTINRTIHDTLIKQNKELKHIVILERSTANTDTVVIRFDNM